jgi:hypothetical protein
MSTGSHDVAHQTAGRVLMFFAWLHSLLPLLIIAAVIGLLYFGLFPLMRWLSAKDYEIQEAARVVEVDPPHLPIARNQFHPAPVKPPRPALPSSDSRTRISREDLDALLNENVRLRLALAQRLAQDNNNTEIEVA